MGSDGKVWLDGFGSKRVGMDGVDSYEVGSEVVGCWFLRFGFFCGSVNIYGRWNGGDRYHG